MCLSPITKVQSQERWPSQSSWYSKLRGGCTALALTDVTLVSTGRRTRVTLHHTHLGVVWGLVRVVDLLGRPQQCLPMCRVAELELRSPGRLPEGRKPPCATCHVGGHRCDGHTCAGSMAPRNLWWFCVHGSHVHLPSSSCVHGTCLHGELVHGVVGASDSRNGRHPAGQGRAGARGVVKSGS